MSLIDQIEMLGSMREPGFLIEQDATQLLLEYSDGGLTRYGAADLITKWRTARGAYAPLLERREQ